MINIFSRKLVQFLMFLFFLVIIFFSAKSQSIPLPKDVKFKMGDDMAWANQSFNDNDWGSKQLGTSWAANEIKDNVYSWYRIKIIIPSSMKSLAEKGKGLKLSLGKIDDVDQTFFNGKLIGQTGAMPPQFIPKWETDRVYTVSVNDILWDKENVIAVRIFSNIGGAGMYYGSYTYAPIQWSDFISFQHSITETDHNGFVTKIKFTNDSNYAFNGTVKYWIADINNKVLFTEAKPVQVMPLKGSENEIAFANYQPSIENIFKVGYQVTENNSTATIKREQVYLANKQIDIKVTSEPKPVVANKIPDAFIPVPLQNQILKGYIGERLAQNREERLLKIDEDGIMAGYLQRPGNQDWAGEHVGKYLEAACNVWKNTHDTRIKKHMDRMAYELINTQLEDGYLGTYLPNEYWTSWDVWSHKYNLYGLLAYYSTTGYRPALEACKKMGNLLCTTFGNKPGQHDITLAGTHIGMAATSVLDPIVELYRYTGDKKYLDFCFYIVDAMENQNGSKIISTLLSTGDVSKVATAKAYEMISNFVGLVNLYRLTGDKKYLNPVSIAWQDIVSKRLYITGTTSSFERFQGDDVLPAGENNHVGEGCVTVTWMQLNHNLLAVTGELKYVEQIEKSIYNHLFAAENPETGCISDYTPLMGKKPFSCGISCCKSSVPRGIAWIPYFTFGNVKNVPTLMMYEPASYKENFTTPGKKNINLALQVESNFPENGNTVITVNTSQAATFPIALRVPSWCNSFTATIGGKAYKGSANQNLVINRVWKSGEKIKVSFQIPIQLIPGGKSYPGQIAFQRGPQVLALDSLLNIDVLKNYQLESDQKLLVEKPGSKSDADVLPKQWIGKQAYTVNIIDTKKNAVKQQLVLVPFADASQTGGAIKVWMPLKVTNK